MKLLSNIALAFVTSTFLVNAEEPVFLYENARICSSSKHGLCLAYDKHKDLVVMDKKHRLRFEVETVEGINMEINRVYTYALDKATRKKVKSCLVKRDIENFDLDGLSLAPCDTDENELVLALSKTRMRDEFMLKELSYMEREAKGEPLCLSMTHYNEEEALELVTSSVDFKRKTPVTLQKCSEKKLVAQDFNFRHYTTTTVTTASRSISVEEDQVSNQNIGRFCLLEKPELCMGLSLTNGTVLEKNKFVQIKNHTKNELKDLEDLKMQWFWDRDNRRIATAAEMDFCLEAIYNAPIGFNRPGREIFDDIVHLGACDPSRSVELTDEAFKGLPASERFYAFEMSNSAGNYIELRTEVPAAAKPTTGESSTKCASVVRCVRHENGQCTKYNSKEVEDVSQLETGSYVRLKDCDSENEVAQRFFYISEDTVPMPPTRSPTPPIVSTTAPTPYPTKEPETAAPTPPPPTSFPTYSPTASPVDSGVALPPTEDGKSTNEQPVVKDSVLTAALAVVGFLCFAVIVLGAIYYARHKGEFQELPEEDENFIARV